MIRTGTSVTGQPPAYAPYRGWAHIDPGPRHDRPRPLPPRPPGSAGSVIACGNHHDGTRRSTAAAGPPGRLVVRPAAARRPGQADGGARRRPALRIDRAVADWADAHRPTAAYWVARVLNLLGQGSPLTLFAAGLGVLLAVRLRSVRPMLPPVVAFVLTHLTIGPLKVWTARAAPSASVKEPFLPPEQTLPLFQRRPAGAVRPVLPVGARRQRDRLVRRHRAAARPAAPQRRPPTPGPARHSDPGRAAAGGPLHHHLPRLALADRLGGRAAAGPAPGPAAAPGTLGRRAASRPVARAGSPVHLGPQRSGRGGSTGAAAGRTRCGGHRARLDARRRRLRGLRPGRGRGRRWRAAARRWRSPALVAYCNATARPGWRPATRSPAAPTSTGGSGSGPFAGSSPAGGSWSARRRAARRWR